LEFCKSLGHVFMLVTKYHKQLT